MAKIRTLQILRGTTAQNDAYTGSAGELTMDTTTNELRLHDGSTAGGHVIGSGGGSSIDAGFVMSFAGSTVPAGWLVCDGSAISRTNYADLFAAIGTTYGSGDGSTTFNLPNIHIPTGATATVLTDGVKKTYFNTGWTDNIPKYANTYYDNNLYLLISNQTVAVGNENTNLIADLANSGTLITCIKY